MVTDADYNTIADDVYSVDSQKTSKPYQVGDTVANGKFQVIQVEDNQANGMQAMAVAPVINCD